MADAKESAAAGARMTEPYLANVNHEVRTLISAIFACANLLEDSIQDRREALDLVQVIRRNGDHLLALLDNALDLTKLDSGKMELREARCEVAELVKEVHALMHAQAREKGLTIDVRCDGPVPRWIVTDTLRLRQILLNLLSNAIRFTDEGRVTLTLRRADPSTALPGVCFEVSDTGTGIAQEDLERIFEPFVQVDDGLRRRATGTGLGLTISRKLAEHMGGTLVAGGNAGKGSTFTLLLYPAMAEDSDTVTVIPLLTLADPDFESAPRRPAKLDGVHVVLAVRRSDLRLALSVMLKTAGARLTLADDDVSPASLLAARFAPEDGAQVVVIELDRPRALRPDTFPALRGATPGVVAIQPSGLPPAVAEQIRLAGVECLTEPLDALRIVNTVARAADAQANRSAG